MRTEGGATPRRRLELAVLGVIGPVVLTTAILFVGGQSGSCLGPLGITAVGCAAATGIVPPGEGDTRIAIAALAFLWLAALLLVAMPLPRERLRAALLASGAGGELAAVTYLAVRSRTMEGYAVIGEWVTEPKWVSLERPLDLLVLATVAAAGAATGAAAWAYVVPFVRRRLARRT